jgi:hypothetical protein
MTDFFTGLHSIGLQGTDARERGFSFLGSIRPSRVVQTQGRPSEHVFSTGPESATNFPRLPEGFSLDFPLSQVEEVSVGVCARFDPVCGRCISPQMKQNGVPQHYANERGANFPAEGGDLGSNVVRPRCFVSRHSTVSHGIGFRENKLSGERFSFPDSIRPQAHFMPWGRHSESAKVSISDVVWGSRGYSAPSLSFTSSTQVRIQNGGGHEQ